MRLGMVAGLALLAMVAATPAAAIPTADWAIFLEDSYSSLGMDDGEPDWEDHLFAAAEEEPDISRAVARFAHVIGVDPAKAETYADAIVAATVLRERCDSDPCQFGPGQPDYERVMTPALAEPSGELLWAVGRNLGTDGAPLGPVAFARAVQPHPQRVRILTRLYDYARDEALLASLLLDNPREPALQSALLGAGASVSGGPDGWDGWQLAVLETSARRAADLGAPAGEQAVYAQAILARYFNLGLTDQGLELYRAYPAEVRALLPLASPPCDENDQNCAGREAGEVLADELTSALWLSGDHAGAEAFSRHAEARLGAAGQWDSRPRRLAVLDAIERSRPAADLFGLMVEGDGLDPENHHSGMSGEGWMFLNYGPASRTLVAQRLRDAGYASIAGVISGRDLYYRTERGGYEDGLSRMGGFPTEVEARRRELAARIEAAWTAAGGGSRSARAATAAGHPDGWTEGRLPAGMTPWIAPTRPDDDDEASPPPPELADLPVPAEAVLRHEVIDGERYVLFQSSELDLPGEIPAYGVWVVRTEGGEWTKPAYLGLQQYFPYVVTPASALPLVETGRLQIEVQVREIAPGSITFPPVGLSLARQEDGVVVTRDLADVFRDRDSDGLTDIAETRLGLDPARADTDGDGRDDGADPVPLTAPSGMVPPARRSLALAILQQLTGYDAGAIVVTPRPAAEDPLEMEDMLADMGSPPPEPPLRTVIVVSNDPALFADLDVPFRLMVYTPEQIRRLSESAAPFYPPSVEIHSSLDGREHFVVWSASWVGGSFMARCPEAGGPCQVEEKSGWIT